LATDNCMLYSISTVCGNKYLENFKAICKKKLTETEQFLG